ncbi:16S rRNA (guanine(527)-N(7))-methyltransferase RsmG [Thermotoga sp. KOL6]|uniref:16S rRNA (guanine(527)-N(7))-methyltransferase RsmG n=1 Tax=Thermotoga sp. KOL6 TaxID=126741 RepID=UPI000CB9C025|nr:16S rRNA (guanine(527)-N(7))-methyltransferase RsmG [Thermotoga sp. KOL6]PLV59407.1 16S rRNA (guanine(527)-N(7))-methyltransferase RsmG [Thermotoga sp. KOL6]
MDTLKNILKEYGLELQEVQVKKVALYLEELLNVPYNLTAHRKLDSAIHKNVAEILVPLKGKSLKGTLLDVGSGNGVPGVILAIFFPKLKVILLDSKMKATVFLKKITDKLNLNNVEIVEERAENFSRERRETFDYVTARAVARLNTLIEICAPALKVGGELFFYKGPSFEKEIREAKNAMNELGVKLKEVRSYSLKSGEKRVLLIFRKEKNSPEKYPRRVGIPFKRPL